MNMSTRDEEKEFKDRFVVNFLAAYAASRYVDDCAMGTHMKADSFPIEDAQFLAGLAWEQHQNLAKP